MTCPECNADHRWLILDTRPQEDGTVHRIRECRVCALRVVTVEKIVRTAEPQIGSKWFYRRMRKMKEKINED